MKIVKPSFEILDNEFYECKSILKYIERIARVCYKSEDKITDNSAEKMIKMLVDRGHLAMLEHYMFQFEFFYKFKNLNISDLEFLKYCYIERIGSDFILLVNLRALIEHQSASKLCDELIYSLFRYQYTYLLNMVGINYNKHKDNNIDFYHLYTNKQLWKSVKFVCDRGISHELVRHRASFAQESTRYCNYSKDKFNNQLQFIMAKEYDSLENISWFEWICLSAEDAYNSLDLKAQIKRNILPNCLKTEVVMTYNKSNWKEVFNLRANKAAHPQMQELMYPLEKEMKMYVD